MNRLLQGDCRTILPTLPASSVHSCVTSPPYYGHRNYGMAAQIGLEATPEAYITTLVAVFREVRRILRPDGTLWLNLGDGHTNKQLQLMPARVALALQADGWYLRSDIIWCKPNPMPESITDRPTSAHEHIFLLTKQPRYFYDADAIREPHQANSIERARSPVNGFSHTMTGERGARIALGGKDAMVTLNPLGANARNVWTIATTSYSAAHFATMPPELAERCIKAGTSEHGCCAQCGAPWIRQSEITYRRHDHWMGPKQEARHSRGTAGNAYNEPIQRLTTGWTPACPCHEYRCVKCEAVLDHKDARTTHSSADQMQPMRDPVSASGQQAEMLFEALCSKVDSGQSLHNEGVDSNLKGLPDASSEGPSECNGRWLRDGASAGYGEEAGQASDLGRGGPPQEWQQARQSPQQSGTDGKETARRGKEARLHCDLPSLSEDVSDARQCPHCGSRMEWTTPAPVPCVVLDCFSGAGTTLLAADRLQRHAIGIDLNPTYCAMAKQRVEDDLPLFAYVATGPHP